MLVTPAAASPTPTDHVGANNIPFARHGEAFAAWMALCTQAERPVAGERRPARAAPIECGCFD